MAVSPESEMRGGMVVPVFLNAATFLQSERFLQSWILRTLPGFANFIPVGDVGSDVD
ncbi:hypothetical protein CEXT_506041, partial [Caerostris extrusa]